MCPSRPRATHRPSAFHTHTQTLTSGRLASLPPAARALTTCLRSEPGAEPAPADLPYTTLADGAPYLAPRRLDLRGKR